jgi:hypothetical protein
MKTSLLGRAPALAFGLVAAALMAPAFAEAPAKPAPHAGHAPRKSAPAKAAVHAPARKAAAHKAAAPKTAAKKPEPLKAGALADFGKQSAPSDVVQVANWVSVTRNNGKRGFIIIDKKQAQLYVFDPEGKLKNRTPVLVGKTIGDRALPGSGDKPIAQLRDDEKTTPAGRFLAMRGRNTRGEDVLWIDYQQAIAMHRLASVSAEERRAERLASPDPSDNRISNGCVNIPPRFYDSVLKPTITKLGAIIYVLPETMPPQQVFGSLDINKPVVAQASPSAPAAKPRKTG